MKLTKLKILFFIFIVATLVATIITGLFVDVTRDAAKYAYIAKEIFDTNHWLNISILGEPYEQKPQLMFWLSAISFKLFGVSNFAYKFPIVLFSLLGLFFTYKLGESLYNKKCGKYAATISAFSVLFILYNNDIHTDTPLFTTISLALWQLFEYLKNKRPVNFLFTALALGLCLLIKGPFGVVLPTLAFLAHIVTQNKWRTLFSWQWPLLIILSFIIAMPAFIHLYNNWGIEGIKFFFIRNTFGRFTGSYLGHTPDPFFYIHTIVYMILPWTLFFFAAIFTEVKMSIQKKSSMADNYLLWGFLAFFLIISSSMSKLPNYLMCVLPVISVITSKFILIHAPKIPRLIKTQSIVNILLIVLSFAIFVRFAKPSQYFYITIPIILILFFIIAFKTQNTNDTVFQQTLMSLTIVVFVLTTTVMPDLFGHQAQVKAAAYINQSTKNIVVYNYPKSSLKYIKRNSSFYTLTDSTQYTQTPNPLHFSYNYELMFYCNHKVNHIETPKSLQKALQTPYAHFYTDNEGLNEIILKKTPIDTVITYQHFSLKRTARYFFPKKEKSPFDKKHLVVLK